MQNSFLILEKILKKKCLRGPVYYIPNIGNWGDGLIRYGTLKFFKNTNLDFKEIYSIEELNNIESEKNSKNQLSPLREKAAVIYGGGGGWCKLWNHSVEYLNNLHERYNIITLPSSYESAYYIPNTVFFARDKNESRRNMPHATFCHDMAFYIGDDFSSGGKGRGKGYFFRTDKESANRIDIPPGNYDISLDGNHFSDIAPFFEVLDRFKIVYTDRLHVAIAAALLKKEVHFYPGSYFKNKAVYLASMQDYFNNVIFHEDFCFQLHHN